MSNGTEDSYSGHHSTKNISITKKILLSIIFGSVVILVVVICIVGSGVKSEIKSNHSNIIIKSSCDTTLYPDLCYSTLAKTPKNRKKIPTLKEIIELSLNITMKAVKHNNLSIHKLLQRKDLTPREIGALNDCLETMEETTDELEEAYEDLIEYPNKKSLREQADDLKTLLSAAMTNPETCLDGFSHDYDDKKIRNLLMKDQMHVEKMCSNALAMISNMTDTDIANQERLTGRKLKEEDANGWPEWLSGGDRKLLQSKVVAADVVVAADGSGNYKTISEAIRSAPSGGSKRHVIRVTSGVYKEYVEIRKGKSNIMLLGDGRGNTIITGSKNVIDGSTTFNSATFAVVGDKFLAKDITFQNSAGPSKHQAVALRVGGDLSAFYQCDISGYQDTLYVYANRQFFIQCTITGSIDFIFGNSAVVFQNCDILARRPNSGQKNMITAQGRSDPNQNTGIVMQKCRIGATSDLRSVQGSFPTYLGRPWKKYSRTVVMQSSISDVVRPAGWHEWSGNFALNTLFYGEYQNTGPGAGLSGRVGWNGFKVISSPTEAQVFAPGRFIGGGSWLSSTGFPFSLGL